eukprot:6187435-Lingulodinium_polyedra.AAC.1
MLREATDAIESHGLVWKASSLLIVAGTYAAVQPGETISIQSSMGVTWEFKIVEQLEVLGTM